MKITIEMPEYIDRQEALKVLRARLGFAEEQQWSDEIDTMELLIEQMEDIPTADVREDIKGEWIYIQNAKHDAYWQCSICGNKWADSIYFNVGTANFCPICGAYMRGTQDV